MTITTYESITANMANIPVSLKSVSMCSMIRKGLRKGRTSLCVYDCKYGDRRNPFPDWFELELAGWQQAIKLMEDAVKLGKGDYVHRFSMELISSSQAMGTRGGGTSGSWFPGKPETPQKRHGKGCGGTPFSMPFLLSH